MIRSVTTKLPNNLDIEMHVGLHRPQKPGEDGPVPTGDPFLVVEIWVTDESGPERYRRLTGMTMDDFLKLARDTAKVGKEIMHAAEAPSADPNDDVD